MEKMQKVEAIQICLDAQEVLKKLKKLNKEFINGLPQMHSNIEDNMHYWTQLNADVAGVISTAFERLNEVVERAGWWQRQLAKPLIAEIWAEFKKFQITMARSLVVWSADK